MAAIAVVYTSLTAIRQTDMKRIIAYASVAHMNVILIGMFAMNAQGLEGAMIQQLAHGFVSSALFLCVGVLYDRHHTRLVKYYSGMAHTMPIFVTIFLFFTLANIAMPGTAGFVGEFLILVGAFQVNTTIAVLGATGMVLGGGYSLWLFNRIAYGNLKVQAILLSNAKTRGGTCNSKKEIRLNWRLIQSPQYVIDYVICHELSHLKFMNHSNNFWQQVQLLFPNYKEAELYLKENGFKLYRID